MASAEAIRRQAEPSGLHRLTARNLLGLARWLRVRSQHPVNLFFLGPRSRVRIGGTLRVGDAVRFLSDAVIDAHGTIEIDDDVYFAQGVTLSAFERISIGDHCIFGEYASVHDNDHGLGGGGEQPVGLRPRAMGPVVIGRNVWIGAKRPSRAE